MPGFVGPYAAAVLVAFLVERDGRLVAVLVEVLDPKATRRPDPGPGIEEELDDGPVAVVEHRVARRQTHELPCTGGRQGFRLIPGIGRAPGDELGVGRVGDRDGQLELGSDALEVFVDGSATRCGG